MNQPFVKFHSVAFRYGSATEQLLQDLTLHIAPGWSGVVGANGTGKTTLLKLATRLLEPTDGYIEGPSNAVYCPQRTDDAPESLEKFLLSHSKSAQIIKGQLGILEDWAGRWPTLSHGERKRTQIGVALWREPEILAMDEPTNHVDGEVRRLIASALHSFDGAGLLVSHDRELLDSLCQQCVFIEPPEVVTRPGGYTKGVQASEDERKAAQKQRALKKREYKKLLRTAGKRRNLANQADKKRSKSSVSKKDHDAKQKIDLARVSGKDAVAGKLLRQLDGRLAQTQEELERNEVKKEYALGIWLPSSQSKRNVLLDFPAGSLPLGKHQELHFPDLFLRPDDRIALTGVNGAGKSTLIREIVKSLKIPREHLTYVPQEIDIGRSQEILNQVQALPRKQRGHLMTIVSRLGSRPYRLLNSTTPSPGETRKLLLALGMTRVPHIIIMDEPTNHMDLPSIECLEKALAKCPCCLVLVSHDENFLEKLTHQRWNIVRGKNADRVLRLTIDSWPEA